MGAYPGVCYELGCLDERHLQPVLTGWMYVDLCLAIRRQPAAGLTAVLASLPAQVAVALKERESDIATEDVIQQVQGLWSAPVDWLSHKMHDQDLVSICRHQQRLVVGTFQPASASLSPSCSSI